ncbi:uncharacterized protein [Ptychodera flava]|uniref:uncharacterized protein n=1 Tax=Ptychodera flava TaxID=63121 RepID=UPI00396A8241
MFADASTKAFGTLVYLGYKGQTALIMAKTRVAPTKELTLPQLELMAALIGSKLLRFTYDALKDKVNITRRFLWSDNHSVIGWIRSDKKLPLFIANRVKRINEFPCTVKYCPGQDSDNRDNANNGHANTAAPPEDNAHSTQIGIQHVVDANGYSSITKLLRVSAIVLRFVSNLKKPNARKIGYLTTRELQGAENKWMKDVQPEVYRTDVYLILGQTTKTMFARQLAHFSDEDKILRCGGRLYNAPLEYAAKFPRLLPTHHRFTELVILAAHKCVLHAGLQTTVTQLRQQHWIPKLRQAVKKVIRKCVKCLKVIGKPYQHPVQAPLQKYRVNEAPPFTITGVDFTGMLYVKSEHLWRRLTTEYLTALREHHKIHGKTDNDIRIGDVVLVHSDTSRRINWELATVEKLNYGNDSIIRSAGIRTANGHTNRPIINLYPLEINANTTQQATENNDHVNTTGNQATSSERPPTRTEAAIARCRIQDLNDV